jgi:hypothetical protein
MMMMGVGRGVMMMMMMMMRRRRRRRVMMRMMRIRMVCKEEAIDVLADFLGQGKAVAELTAK